MDEKDFGWDETAHIMTVMQSHMQRNIAKIFTTFFFGMCHSSTRISIDSLSPRL